MSANEDGGVTLPADEDMKAYHTRVSARMATSTANRIKEALLKFEAFLDESGIDSYEDVTEDDMEYYLDWLLNSGSSDLTVEGLFASTRLFLRKNGVDAAEEVDTDFLADTTLTSQHLRDDVHWVTKDEHKQMVEACETLRESLIIQLLWATGVRRSEAAAIRVSDIDRDDKSIHINNAKNPDTREVFYGPQLARTLRQWLDRGGRDQYDTSSESNHLIITNQSEKVNSKYPNEVVKRVADRAGILTEVTTDAAGRSMWRPTSHSYRHAFAIHRVRNGMNIKFLKELLGHRDIESTEFYLQFKGEDLREANERYRPKL